MASDKERQIASAHARLPGGSIADNLDEDDLDNLTGFLETPDMDVNVMDQLIKKAAPIRLHVLNLKQKLPEDALDAIRDLFLEGKDVDAIAVLATELGMIPSGMVTDEVHLVTVGYDIHVQVSDLKGGWRNLIKAGGADPDVTVDHYAKVRDYYSYSPALTEVDGG
jgi:hypothetical protein